MSVFVIADIKVTDDGWVPEYATHVPMTSACFFHSISPVFRSIALSCRIYGSPSKESS